MNKDVFKRRVQWKQAFLRNDLERIEQICITYPLVEAIDKYGNTPLHLYLRHRNQHTLDIVTCLLKHSASAATLQDKYGNTPLHLYLRHRNQHTLDIVTCLLKHGASAATLQNKDGKTPLHIYLNNSYHEPTLDIVTCLLNHNESAVTLQNKDGNTLLHIYLSYGYKPTLDIVTCLLKHNVSAVTLQNKDGNTPLHLYLHHRNKPTLDIVNCLLKHNASAATLQNKNGDTPLHLYLLFRHEPTSDILTRLLRHNTSVATLQNKNGNTLLHLYLRHRNKHTLDIVTCLLKHSASAATLQDKDGNTPLHLYLSNSYHEPTLDIVTCLLKHNASAATLQNKEGVTPVSVLENSTEIKNPKIQTDILNLFDKLLVPAEIYFKGKNAIKLYKDELKNGKISLVNSRCMFLGKEGAGKTSCVKAMVGKKFDSKEPSTNGIVTTTLFQARGNDSGKWRMMKDVDEAKLSKETREHALAKNVDKKLGKENNDNTLVAKAVKFLYKSLTIGKVDVSDITSIWDYAGQLDYYITHRFFLTNTVSYCVAFNVMDNLDEPANPRDPSTDSLGMTNLDMNLFWIRSIYEHTVSRHGPGNPIFIDGQNIESPPISLVATHMDKLSGSKSNKRIKAEKMFMQMFDAMKGMQYSEHVDREMYMVDNTVRSHEGIEKLKRNVGKYMKEMARKVPVKWVDLQERLQIIGKTRLTITLKEISKIGTECGISEDPLTHAIMYLNDTGIIMYSGTNKKLRHIVITNLHWMIQILTKVITVVKPTITAKQMRMLWGKLDNEGVLEEKLLRYLWRNEDEGLFDVFVELMKMFRLLFEKTKGIEKGNRIFLVPCRMKVDKEEKNLEVSKDDEQTVSVYLTPTDFLPDAVYHTLVVAFLEFMTEKGSDDSEVFRNRSDFKFSNHTVSLGSVKISNKKEKPYALKLEISRWTDILQPTAEGGDKETEFKFKPEPSVCMEVLTYLKKQLETTCTIYEGIGYNLRVLCTFCNPSNHHLIDLDKCLKNDLVSCGRKKAMNTAHIKRFFFIEPVSESESETVSVAEPVESEAESESKLETVPEAESMSMVFGGIGTNKEPVPKPESLPASDLESELKPVSAAKTELRPKPESVSKLESELKPVPAPKAEIKPESVPKLESELKPVPAAKPEPGSLQKRESELKPVPAPKPELKPKPESVPKLESELKPVPAPKPELKPRPESVPKLESELKLVPAPKSELKPKPESVPTQESELKPVPAPKPELKPKPVPKLESELKPVPAPKPELRLKPKSLPKPDPGSLQKRESELKPVPAPKPELKPKPESVPKPESELKPVPAPKPESKLESELKPVPAPKSELKPKPESVPTRESELKPVPAPKPELKPKPVPKLESELKSVPAPKPELRLKPKSVPKPELKPVPAPKPELKLKPKSVPKPELKPVPAPKPVPKRESRLKPVPALKPVPKRESGIKPVPAPKPNPESESVPNRESELLEPVPAPKPELESVSSRVFGELPKKKFQTMLVQVSNWYDEHCSLDMLKVFCKDLVTPYSDLQTADTTMKLFISLRRAGNLTVNNFKVLIDIINVTSTKGALEANKYLKNTFEESDHHVTTVTTYRQKLIDFGKILSQDNVRKLIHLNDVSRKQRDNQWTVILYLEERGILREDRLLSFIEHLKENKLDVAAENLENSI
ncbi:uncharacterized protein [Antedon mediterranea]|uniref:uncharacterized protein n=1 Tax=Antedon mediterranea TaxID=105859 RepID=UPI003AF91A86